MLPRIFGEDLFDNFMIPFEDSFMRGHTPFFGKRENDIMKTDIKEKDGNYILEMDIPGYDKKDVSVKLNNGYITVEAQRNINNDEKGKDGNYIRRERYYGNCQRSFYVGDNVKEKDIKAKFDSGILYIEFPSNKINKQIENGGYISIEG